jgi:hypothetical protein
MIGIIHRPTCMLTPCMRISPRAQAMGSTARAGIWNPGACRSGFGCVERDCMMWAEALLSSTLLLFAISISSNFGNGDGHLADWAEFSEANDAAVLIAKQISIEGSSPSRCANNETDYIPISAQTLSALTQNTPQCMSVDWGAARGGIAYCSGAESFEAPKQPSISIPAAAHFCGKVIFFSLRQWTDAKR